MKQLKLITAKMLFESHFNSEDDFNSLNNYFLCKDKLNGYCEEFIELFSDKLNWYNLSKVIIIEQNEKVIEKYSDKFDWFALFDTRRIWSDKIRLSEEFFKKFYNIILKLPLVESYNVETVKMPYEIYRTINYITINLKTF